MALNFQPLSMMELRRTPGEVLDRVAEKREAFIVERSGRQLACLVPLSLFMPDIQPTRLNREFERLRAQSEAHTVSITDEHELELHFRGEGSDHNTTLTVRLPHGYPSACPKVYAHPLPDRCPHRWQDGSLCLFGALDLWNPGQHDAGYVLHLARRWLASLETWRRTGAWAEEQQND